MGNKGQAMVARDAAAAPADEANGSAGKRRRRRRARDSGTYRRRKNGTPVALPAWVRLVRDAEVHAAEVLAGQRAASDEDVMNLVGERLAAEEVETMLTIAVDGRNRVLAVQEIARGGGHGCVVSAREIFRVAVAVGASGVVICHNHPSGAALPSAADDKMTAAGPAGPESHSSYLASGWLDDLERRAR